MPAATGDHSCNSSKVHKTELRLKKNSKYMVKINNLSWLSTRRATYMFSFKIVDDVQKCKNYIKLDSLIEFQIFIGGNCFDLVNEFTTRAITIDTWPSLRLETKNDDKHYKIIIKEKNKFKIKSIDGTFIWKNETNGPSSIVNLTIKQKIIQAIK